MKDIEMYKELSHSECISDKIESGEKFPVGFRTYMIADYEQFSELFEKIGKNAERLAKNLELKEWYSKMKIDLDFSLFCHMMSFNSVMRQQYPDVLDSKGHADFYISAEQKKLSEAISQKKCACTEYAVLAQAYFQKQNIPTRYVGGELVVNDEFDDFEAHSFIAFSNNGKEYIFDPVNPYIYNGGKSILPHISECIGKKDLCHLQTKSLFKKGENWRYSCGEHGDFLRDLPTKRENLQERPSKYEEDGENLTQRDGAKTTLSVAQQVVLNAKKTQH